MATLPGFPCENHHIHRTSESRDACNDGAFRRALDNIPDFNLERSSDDSARHGSAMFATGVIEGLRQAIYAIETNRTEVQPSNKWPGMNAAIAAVEQAISQRQAEKSKSA